MKNENTNQNILKNSFKFGDSAQAVKDTIGHDNHLKNIEEIKKIYLGELANNNK